VLPHVFADEDDELREEPPPPPLNTYGGQQETPRFVQVADNDDDDDDDDDEDDENNLDNEEALWLRLVEEIKEQAARERFLGIKKLVSLKSRAKWVSSTELLFTPLIYDRMTDYQRALVLAQVERPKFVEVREREIAAKLQEIRTSYIPLSPRVCVRYFLHIRCYSTPIQLEEHSSGTPEMSVRLKQNK